MNMTQSLLTENRYWTFWSTNWQTKVTVLWNGKTKWSKVVHEVGRIYFGIVPFGYERQVELKNPDIQFD